MAFVAGCVGESVTFQSDSQDSRFFQCEDAKSEAQIHVDDLLRIAVEGRVVGEPAITGDGVSDISYVFDDDGSLASCRREEDGGLVAFSLHCCLDAVRRGCVSVLGEEYEYIYYDPEDVEDDRVAAFLQVIDGEVRTFNLRDDGDLEVAVCDEMDPESLRLWIRANYDALENAFWHPSGNVDL